MWDKDNFLGYLGYFMHGNSFGSMLTEVWHVMLWIRCLKQEAHTHWEVVWMGLYKAACDREKYSSRENLSKDELVWWEKGDPLLPNWKILKCIYSSVPRARWRARLVILKFDDLYRINRNEILFFFLEHHIDGGLFFYTLCQKTTFRQKLVIKSGAREAKGRPSEAFRPLLGHF